MKHALQIFGLGLFMVTLSSCDTYVNGGGYAGVRPGYYHRAPAYPASNNYWHYGHNHPAHYYSRPEPRSAGVNARVNAGVLPLKVNSSTRLGLF